MNKLSTAFVFLFAVNQSLHSGGYALAQTRDFDSIKLYELTNDSGMKVTVTNYGAIISSIIVPDRDGNLGDVVLGYHRVEDYINAVDKPYFGAIVGRYGNRIAHGRFRVDGREYTLLKNNGDHHLHGGGMGFDKVVWSVDSYSEGKSLTLSYLSKDKEEGYPGNVLVNVIYQLQNNNTLTVEYRAKTDKATPINLTQHTYFNLKGEGNGAILNHELMINAKQFTPVDEGLIPTGELLSVAGTPFDFTKPKAIGRDIEQGHEQLKVGRGYDHNWILETEPHTVMNLAARVSEPSTGRILEVRTTEPGIQFYCGNFLNGRLKGKAGRPYVHRGGFCLETQHFPDSPNQPNFPSTILRPGETYESQTSFRFSVE